MATTMTDQRARSGIGEELDQRLRLEELDPDLVEEPGTVPS